MENSPSITLRKGKTEIKIDNAAAVIKKINEMYPSRVEYDGWYYAPSWNKKQKRTEAEIERQRQWIESAKDWFKTEMFSGTGSFEVVVTEPESPKPEIQTKADLLNHIRSFVPPKFVPPKFRDPEPIPYDDVPPKQEPALVQSVNKNTYEIRESILHYAINVVQCLTNKSTDDLESVTNKILQTANRFYDFVENKNKKHY